MILFHLCPYFSPSGHSLLTTLFYFLERPTTLGVIYRASSARCNCVKCSVFGPPGSGSVSQRYGSGFPSGSRSAHHQAKKENPRFLLFCDFFM